MLLTNKNENDVAGFTLSGLLIGLGVVIIICAVGYSLVHPSHITKTTTSSSNTTSSPTTATSNPYAVLSPATVAPKIAECSQKLTYASNGDSSPIQCSNGDLNVLEWNALSALEPSVMTLGYNATESQVESALCSDAGDSDSDANTNASNIIETTTYQISALYYGWNFSSNPAAELSNGTC